MIGLQNKALAAKIICKIMTCGYENTDKHKVHLKDLAQHLYKGFENDVCASAFVIAQRLYFSIINQTNLYGTYLSETY